VLGTKDNIVDEVKGAGPGVDFSFETTAVTEVISAATGPCGDGVRCCRNAPTVGTLLRRGVDFSELEVLRDGRARGCRHGILVVGSPTILPDSGPGCFPVVPLNPGDVAYLRQTTKRLNSMLAEQAGEVGAEYVDTYQSSIGHDVCQLPGAKWVEGLVPTSPTAPVHPNAPGERNSANNVLNTLHVYQRAGA
jgi:hypothetical protein